MILAIDRYEPVLPCLLPYRTLSPDWRRVLFHHCSSKTLGPQHGGLGRACSTTGLEIQAKFRGTIAPLADHSVGQHQRWTRLNYRSTLANITAEEPVDVRTGAV